MGERDIYHQSLVGAKGGREKTSSKEKCPRLYFFCILFFVFFCVFEDEHQREMAQTVFVFFFVFYLFVFFCVFEDEQQREMSQTGESGESVIWF